MLDKLLITLTLKIKVLTDIWQFLHVFHVVQELVSAAKRKPILSLVRPMYKRLNMMLQNLAQELPGLLRAIHALVELKWSYWPHQGAPRLENCQARKAALSWGREAGIVSVLSLQERQW